MNCQLEIDREMEADVILLCLTEHVPACCQILEQAALAGFLRLGLLEQNVDRFQSLRRVEPLFWRERNLSCISLFIHKECRCLRRTDADEFAQRQDAQFPGDIIEPLEVS